MGSPEETGSLELVLDQENTPGNVGVGPAPSLAMAASIHPDYKIEPEHAAVAAEVEEKAPPSSGIMVQAKARELEQSPSQTTTDSLDDPQVEARE